MRFHEAANTLFALRRFGTRPGTEVTADLLAHLEDPHKAYPCVQVAGSNGKGSTARILASVLREAGLSVGLYTSPHLDDVRERVRVNGRPIRKAALAASVEEMEGYVTDRAVEGEAPTFFEALTALALREFERQAVDIAVLEVGIGGRYDATSVVDPVASAVTSVTLEHTDLLGGDVETIAQDVAAVAPTDRPLVTAVTGDALAGVRATAGEVLTVGTGDRDVTIGYGGREGVEGTATVGGRPGEDTATLETRLALLGAHQAHNAGIAVTLARQVADTLGRTVDDSSLRRGLRNAHWPGRFEVLRRDPLVVLDGAHNPEGCVSATETLAEFPVESLSVVVGALTDKDHRGIAAALPEADHITVTEPAEDRAESRDVLAKAVKRETDADVSTHPDVAGAFADALGRAGSGDAVLVTGSLYTVAEARQSWNRTLVPARVRSTGGAKAVLAGAHVTDTDIADTVRSAVHRVVRTRVRPRQAKLLRAEFRAVGGDVAVSGVDAAENRGVVLTGTVAQFRALCGRLDGSERMDPLAADIREFLDDDTRDGHEPGDHPEYPWADGTAVMGILNVTPDSFHDGGEFEARADAVDQAERMVEAGVDIVDIGGESTRPGADPVPVAEEKARVRPVVEALSDLEVAVSIDTRKAPVARAALDAGADILNDVSGLADPEMRLVAADYDVPVVVMHSIETPVDPDSDIAYDDVVADVLAALEERVLLAEQAGLDRSQIIVDPGVGFGKSRAESFELLARIDEFRALGCPVLVGHSHKSMFAEVDRGPDERLEATVAASALAARRGADIVRVHDVDENVAAVDVADATNKADHG